MNLLELLRSQARKYRCPECGHTMADCGIEILVQQGNQALVRVTCTGCKDENLLKIVLQTEALEEHAERRPRQPAIDEGLPEAAHPIEVDEVLDLHATLASWDGDLRTLVSPPPSS
jgi:hypothetical protein